MTRTTSLLLTAGALLTLTGCPNMTSVGGSF